MFNSGHVYKEWCLCRCTFIYLFQCKIKMDIGFPIIHCIYKCCAFRRLGCMPIRHSSSAENIVNSMFPFHLLHVSGKERQKLLSRYQMHQCKLSHHLREHTSCRLSPLDLELKNLWLLGSIGKIFLLGSRRYTDLLSYQKQKH